MNNYQLWYHIFKHSTGLAFDRHISRTVHEVSGKPLAYQLLKSYSVTIERASSLGISQGYNENSARDMVLITAKAAVDTVNELSKAYPKHVVQKAMIGRILRGVPWTIHNGGAPGTRSWDKWNRVEDRSLECSLSRKWLKSKDIIYIS